MAGNVKKLFIIDGHSHIYAAYFAPMRQKLTSPAGEPTKATYIFTTAIVGLIARHKPDMLVVAMKKPMLRVNGFEADDIIGTIAKKAGASPSSAVVV